MAERGGLCHKGLLCDITFSLEIAERNIDRLAGEDAEDTTPWTHQPSLPYGVQLSDGQYKCLAVISAHTNPLTTNFNP